MLDNRDNLSKLTLDPIENPDHAAGVKKSELTEKVGYFPAKKVSGSVFKHL